MVYAALRILSAITSGEKPNRDDVLKLRRSASIADESMPLDQLARITVRREMAKQKPTSPEPAKPAD